MQDHVIFWFTSQNEEPINNEPYSQNHDDTLHNKFANADDKNKHLANYGRLVYML